MNVVPPLHTSAKSPPAPGRDLAAVKNDCGALLDVLNLAGQRPGNHHPCQFCGNKDALSISQGEAGWRYRCHKCGAAGSIVDAVVSLEGITPAAAITRLCGPGNAPRRSPPKPLAAPAAIKEPAPPVPNLPLLRRYLDRAQKNLWESAALHRWLDKRGIPLVTAKAYGLGFAEWTGFTGWKHPIKNAWHIPITDADGNILAVKLHKESPCYGPKALWLPVGTQPPDRPRHGFSTLWPPPESFWPQVEYEERAAVYEYDAKLPRAEAECRARLDAGRAAPWLYLCPGELKALAIIGAGLQSTSITAGEAWRWTPNLLARLAGRRVCICFDDDVAGHKFRNATAAALCDTALELRAVTFGKIEKVKNGKR